MSAGFNTLGSTALLAMADLEHAKKQLGARLRAARVGRRLSQAELAESVGVTVESISRAERGTITPTIWTLQSVAKALNMDVGALIKEPVRKNKERPLVQQGARMMELLDDELLEPVIDLLAVISRRAGRKRGAK